MKRSRTAPENILAIYRVVLLAVWALVVVGGAALLIHAEGGREGAWLEGAVVLAIAGFASVGIVRYARSSWRRALARPIPARGLHGWLWRQPGWRLALIIWACELVAVAAIETGLVASGHGQRPAWFFVVTSGALALGMAMTAVGQAAGWCVIRQSQREPQPGV